MIEKRYSEWLHILWGRNVLVFVVSQFSKYTSIYIKEIVRIGVYPIQKFCAQEFEIKECAISFKSTKTIIHKQQNLSFTYK